MWSARFQEDTCLNIFCYNCRLQKIEMAVVPDATETMLMLIAK